MNTKTPYVDKLLSDCKDIAKEFDEFESDSSKVGAMSAHILTLREERDRWKKLFMDELKQRHKVERTLEKRG